MPMSLYSQYYTYNVSMLHAIGYCDVFQTNELYSLLNTGHCLRQPVTNLPLACQAEANYHIEFIITSSRSNDSMAGITLSDPCLLVLGDMPW